MTFFETFKVLDSWEVQRLICGALRDLVPCAQFKKREKHPSRSVNFSKVAAILSQFSITMLPGQVKKPEFC